MPLEENHKVGHKYPFNACEILSSENSFIIDKFLESIKDECDLADRKDSDMSDIYKDDHSESESESSDLANSDVVKLENIELNENSNNNNIEEDNKLTEDSILKEDQENLNLVGSTNNITHENSEPTKPSDGENNTIENKKFHHKKNPGGTHNFMEEDIFNISQEESISLDNNTLKPVRIFLIVE